MSTAGWECRDTRETLGVYVLEAIDSRERDAVDAHLRTCAACRAGLDDLAGLPGVLAQVNEADIGPMAGDQLNDIGVPPESLAAAVRSLAAHRRRRSRRWQVSAAAAAVLIAVAGGVAGTRLVTAPLQPPPAAAGNTAAAPPASWLTARTSGLLPGVNATARYIRTSWGVAYELQLTGIPAGTTCQLWVTNSQGVHLAAGGWTVSAHDLDAWYPGSTWLAQPRSIDVTAGNQLLATFAMG